MAFKINKGVSKKYPDIESLFRDLNTKGIESIYNYQSDVLRNYENKAKDKPNVALELPTGSGKTLIGLLIAEFRRRNYNERVLYLCPTIQLANQVVELANKSYGINATIFTGSKYRFSAESKSKYRNKTTIAVATYSSLFNIKPFFTDADLIILDDAHAAENYISSNWSLRISRFDHFDIFEGIVERIRPYINEGTYRKLLDDDIDPTQKSVVNVLAGYQQFEILQSLTSFLDSTVGDYEDLKYNYSQISHQFECCHLYYNWKEILIRPVIPPSLTNETFNNAKQRIFMSATLGNGGDLERVTGIKEFMRISIPQGWETQGLGRRFINFPNMSLDEEETDELLAELIKSVERSVVLVSSDIQVSDFHDYVDDFLPDFEVFGVEDFQNSKDSFIQSKKGIAILANRFDGMDFPGNQARLLIIKDIPYASNLQESFLQSRVNASVIFFDRNRTRLVQALGRCTRSPKDYSAVVILGERDISEWLTFPEKRKFFHPELQAELKFGADNSEDSTKEDFIENFNDFMAQGEKWAQGHEHIIDLRGDLEREEIPGEKELDNGAKLEVEYQYLLWEGKYEDAAKKADDVFEALTGGTVLSGYRAFWKYLAGCAYFLEFKSSNTTLMKTLSSERFNHANRISGAFPFLKSFEGVDKKKGVNEIHDNIINNLIAFLKEQKISSPRKYGSCISLIEDNLYKDGVNFEAGHEMIGKLLGYETGNSLEGGAPDPYWIIDEKTVLVFEDKIYERDDRELKLSFVRQLKSHNDWIKAHVKSISTDVNVIRVFLTNAKGVESKAHHLCDDLFYWSHESFVTWSKSLLTFIKELHKSYTGDETGEWKEYLMSEFKKRALFPEDVLKNLLPLKSLIK